MNSDLKKMKNNNSSILLSSLLLLLISVPGVLSIEVDCSDVSVSKVSCRCVGFDRSTNGIEDLSEIVSNYIQGRFVNTVFNHIELIQCERLDLVVNLRAFVVNNRPQNISTVSFENIDQLNLDIQNIDFGRKQFVFKSVKYLSIAGRLDHPTTRVSFFIHNDRFSPGEVTFSEFYARSRIELINIQDARSVRVYNSVFDNLYEVDIFRTDSCYLGPGNMDNVPCTQNDLFVSTVSYPGSLTGVLRHPVFITFVGLFIIAILLAIFGFIYVKHWKKKKELELLGYPASTISRSSPSHSSTRVNAKQINR